MSTVTPSRPIFDDNGLQVIDLAVDDQLADRKLRTRDIVQELTAMQRMARVFVEHPETMLQELVEIAVELCGADSAGISIVRENATDQSYYEWVATAGDYQDFFGAVLPRFPSACSITLERGRPQLFRVSQRFFDILGVVAPPVMDGLLLPWRVGETTGTIFVMSHAHEVTFDNADRRIMELVADFAAMAVRHERQQRATVSNATAAAAAAMANVLAHEINNPLQGLTNEVYLAAEGLDSDNTQDFARKLTPSLNRLSSLAKRLLELPSETLRRSKSIDSGNQH